MTSVPTLSTEYILRSWQIAMGAFERAAVKIYEETELTRFRWHCRAWNGDGSSTRLILGAGRRTSLDVSVGAGWHCIAELLSSRVLGHVAVWVCSVGRCADCRVDAQSALSRQYQVA